MTQAPCGKVMAARHQKMPRFATAPIVEAQAKAGFGQHTSKRGLAHFQRITPQVVAVQLDQVESVEEYPLVSAVVTDEIERGNRYDRRRQLHRR